MSGEILFVLTWCCSFVLRADVWYPCNPFGASVPSFGKLGKTNSQVNDGERNSMSRVLVDAALEGHVLAGRYEVKRRVAKGGMAWIYLATDNQTQRDVALKILFSKWQQDEKVAARFMTEVRIHEALSHPNIIRVDGLVEDGGLLGMAMEWVGGGDLKEWLENRQEPLSTEEIHALIVPLLDALGYAHQQGVVHRDIKPGNVLLVESGGNVAPKLTDFGIAKMLQEPGGTATGAKLGTPNYMAPEQWRDSKKVDHRADIYSLGVLLYRMASGRLPFEGDYRAVIVKLLDEAAPYPQGVPAPLAGLILRAVEKEPEDRFASCEAFSSALKKYFALEETAETPASAPASAAPPVGGGTLAYIPSFSVPRAVMREDSDPIIGGEPDELIIPDTIEPFADNAALMDEILGVDKTEPETVAATAATTPEGRAVDGTDVMIDIAAPKASASSGFRETVQFGQLEGQSGIDEELQKALALAEAAKEAERQAKLKTMALDENDPEFAHLQAIVQRGKGVASPSDPARPSSVEINMDELQPKKGGVPMWAIVTGALILVAVGVTLGWWLART